MSPFLALLLCTGFVGALLWIDRKRGPGMSGALWVPTLWVLFCASRTPALWLHDLGMARGATSVEQGNPLDRAVLGLLIGAGLVILARRRIRWSQVVTNNWWLLVLFVYMLVSILWSDFPLVSLKRWIKTGGTVIMAIAILSESEPLESLETVLRRTAYVLIPLSGVLVRYFPGIGIVYGRWSGHATWAGATVTKNTLGVLCMTSVFFLVWTLVRRWERKEPVTVRYQTLADLLVLGLALWLMRGPGGAYSATSVLVLVLGAAAFFFLRRMHGDSTRLHSITFLTVVTVLSLPLVTDLIFSASPVELASALFGRNPTLTGRTDVIWSELIPLSMEHPVFGVGYGAFWIRPVFDFAINQAHNGYLDVFIELGAVGVALLAMLVVVYFRKAKDEFDQDRDWASLRIAFLLIVLVHNLTETSFLRSTILLWNVFIFFMVVHTNERGQQDTPSAPLSDETVCDLAT